MKGWFKKVLGGLLLLAASGCAPDGGARLGFILVRAEPAAAVPGGLRAEGLDRERVVLAECQVLDAAGREVVGGRVPLDAQSAPGEQTLALDDIPPAAGYFARIRGYDDGDAVVECGASGPFELRRGDEHLVTLIIRAPAADDPRCEYLCADHADCPANMYCPSPCVRNPAAVECTEALCRRDYIGQACTEQGDCGPGFACLTDAGGWPDGYCSAACVTDANCPGRSLCAHSGAQMRCVRVCSQDTDCRAADGYACLETGDGRTGCLPR